MAFLSITSKTLPASELDPLLLQAGYTKIGSAPAKGNRLKSWWNHPKFARVEVIYSPDGTTAITAYHIAS
jgi:hypothetical protein